MKKLHRLIVTSNTYRMQSTAGSKDNPNLARDGDNNWLWRMNPRRIEAEVVRDSILHVAGELDLALGGPVLESAAEATSRRRSLYFSIYPEDGGRLKFLEFFDAPDPCDCYRRTQSIVPQQALALTNSGLLLDEGRLLTRKLSGQLGGSADESAFIVAAFEQVLARRPTEQEQAACKEFLRKQTELYRSVKELPMTGSRVAPSAEPGMRARESLVRALFSHDDFVTVR